MGAGREGGKGNGGRKGGKGEPDHFAECHRVMNLAKASGKEGKDKDDGWAGGCQETAPSETPSEPEQTAVLAMLPEDNSCEEDGFGAEGSGTEGGSGAEGDSTEGSGRGSGAEDNGTEGSEEGSATEGSTSEPLTEEAPEAEAAAAVFAELPDRSTQPNSTCHLCRGSVGADYTTFFMQMHMCSHTYEHSVQVCHNCFEDHPGPNREEDDLYTSLQLETEGLMTLYQDIILSLMLPDTAAINITDYVFPRVTGSA